ncbi:phage terminase small subunit P27 family [Caldanaerobacter sp.]|uniref:phage terminase small subunit P27 family n=1 Tax=Caldanaerobacter sp. TaxID=2930036 RepID=UPI003C778775
MGARGPAPKPTALKVLLGNPGKRPLNRNEPKPEVGLPKCPSWLPKEVKKKWKELGQKLERIGLITKVDDMAFMMMLMHWYLACEAAKAISQEGLITKDSKGRPRKNPLHQVLRDHSDSLKSYLSEFGLTPSSRSKLNVPQPEEQDDISALLGY